MDQVEPSTLATPLPSRDASTPMPPAALVFRWFIGLSGLISLLALLPSFRTTDMVDLALLFVVGVAADLFFTVELSQRRWISLGATFTFISFLSFGAIGAALVSVVAWCLAQFVEMLIGKADARRQPVFIAFNAGQLAICALGAGLVTWAVTGTGLDSLPRDWTLPLLVYVVTSFGLNVAIATVATALRSGMREVRERLWPGASAWTALSFAICGPLAVMAVALATQIGLLSAILLTFVALVSLSYILRLTVSYDRANAELRVLNEIGASLTATLDFGTLFPSIYRNTGKLMDVDAFFIALTDQDRREIHYGYLVENGVEIAPRSLPFGPGLASRVIGSREALLVEQLDRQATPMTTFGQSGRPLLSALVAPLLAGEGAIGAISAQSYQANAYTPRQLELLVAISRVAAVAIHNAQLFEREKAILREREEFVSLVAHELKNPLAAIMGYHQLATRRMRPDDDGLRKPLQVIAEQSQRLNRLVGDLLDLSRADAGRLALDRQPIDLAQLVRDAVDQQQIQTTQHRLEMMMAPPLPPVQADKMRIGQVLHNLLGNAIKYSPEGGRIDVRASVWTHHDERWPQHLRHRVSRVARWEVVEVQDRGMGIPDEELPRVFSRFFRAKNTAEAHIQGVGLGLAICAELIRAHGGVIWVTSTLGGGSTFAFALPI